MIQHGVDATLTPIDPSVQSAPPMRILVVDAEDSVRRTLSTYLSAHGFSVDVAACAADVRLAFASRGYDMVLLDFGARTQEGIALACDCRAQGVNAIICTSRNVDEADVVMALELAADDYVAKPYSLRQLLARMRAVARRTAVPVRMPLTRNRHPRAYRFGAWTLNLNTRKLQALDGRKAMLTNGEFNLLVVLLGAQGRVVTREQCLEHTRAFDDVFDRSIDVQILRLRRKIEDNPRRPLLLRTMRGVGYWLDTPVDALWA